MLDKIVLRAGAVLGRRKMAKHFALTITDTSFAFTRNTEAIAREAALDGFYVLRTNVPAELLDTAATVLAYKSLAGVQRAFRSIKTVDLEIRSPSARRQNKPRSNRLIQGRSTTYNPSMGEVRTKGRLNHLNESER